MQTNGKIIIPQYTEQTLVIGYCDKEMVKDFMGNYWFKTIKKSKINIEYCFNRYAQNYLQNSVVKMSKKEAIT